jgi:hypothetical protein
MIPPSPQQCTVDRKMIPPSSGRRDHFSINSTLLSGRRDHFSINSTLLSGRRDHFSINSTLLSGRRDHFSINSTFRKMISPSTQQCTVDRKMISPPTQQCTVDRKMISPSPQQRTVDRKMISPSTQQYIVEWKSEHFPINSMLLRRRRAHVLFTFFVFVCSIYLKKNGDHASDEPILCLLNTYSLYYRYIKYVFWSSFYNPTVPTSLHSPSHPTQNQSGQSTSVPQQSFFSPVMQNFSDLLFSTENTSTNDHVCGLFLKEKSK